jgi:hypothetical protein
MQYFYTRIQIRSQTSASNWFTSNAYRTQLLRLRPLQNAKILKMKSDNCEVLQKTASRDSFVFYNALTQ